jgi:DNA gyrase inhibitor GyrI
MPLVDRKAGLMKPFPFLEKFPDIFFRAEKPGGGQEMDSRPCWEARRLNLSVKPRATGCPD